MVWVILERIPEQRGGSEGDTDFSPNRMLPDEEKLPPKGVSSLPLDIGTSVLRRWAPWIPDQNRQAKARKMALQVKMPVQGPDDPSQIPGFCKVTR